VRNFLAQNETAVVPQPPYSPDLAPADFFMFRKLTFTLKGRRFDTFDEIQKNSTKELFAIPKEAFQSWQKRWERCVASEGNYFEGYKLDSSCIQHTAFITTVRSFIGHTSYMNI